MSTSEHHPTARKGANLISLPTSLQPTADPSAADPIHSTSMVVAVDDIDLYDRDPRQVPNDKYDEIKASLYASGMDQTLTISRRPGLPRYMISAGGNTRLQIIKALWADTGEERFRTVHCLFRPWESDVNALTAHLRENDVRGDLVFVDRARALMQIKMMVEEENGAELSQREFLSLIAERGYPVGHPLLVSAIYTIESLENAIPAALWAGLKRTQVDQIRKLHKAFVTAWHALKIADVDGGEQLFLDLLRRHDDEVIDPDLIRRDAVNELSVSADCDVQYASALYGAVLNGRNVDHLVEHILTDTHADDGSDAITADGSTNDVPNEPTPSISNRSARRTTVSASVTPPNEHSRSSQGSLKDASTDQQGGQMAKAASAIPQFENAQNVKALRTQAQRLADTAARMLGCDNIIVPIETGLGFLVDAVPAKIREAIPLPQRGLMRPAWWMLVSVSEQFATHGLASQHIPPQWVGTPVGEGMANARQFDDWQQAGLSLGKVDTLLAVPTFGSCDYAAGLHKTTQEFFDTWLSLVATTRRIYEITNGQPWL